MATATVLEMLRPLRERLVEWETVEHVFSVQWWLESVLAAYKEDPEHVFIEALCVLIIVYLLMRPSYDPTVTDDLTVKEEDALIAEWEPEPICERVGVPQAPGAEESEDVVLESVASAEVTLAGGRRAGNFCGNDFAGLAGNADVLRQCEAAIEKYGVGSCGPRGFYGTIDVHLELEKAMSELYGVEEAILYSDSVALLASVIPAFAKRGDLVILDEAVNFGIQQGTSLARSNVLYYKHNDMRDLERVLQDVAEKDRVRGVKKPYRKFLVCEGVSREHGDVVPLDELVDLKNKYKYRLILDDTLALGVLGKTGRGTCEHFGVDTAEVHFLCAGLDAALGTVGGICAGSHEVVDHQRLSGLGYCFSASSPPYTAVAGTAALDVLLREPQRVAAVQKNARAMRAALASIKGVRVVGGGAAAATEVSPVIYLRLAQSLGSREADQALFHLVRQKLLDNSLVTEVPRHILADRLHGKVPPALRVTVTAAHKPEAVAAAADQIARAFDEALRE